jgi:hypothetical protein
MKQRQTGLASSLCLAALSLVLATSGMMSGCSDDASPGADAGPAACNNGVVEAGEACDPGAGACCNATCDGFLAAGTECRAAASGCDAAETCSGSSAACPDDALSAAGAVCRPATGECDVAETCDGASNACPADAFGPDEVACDDCVLGSGNCSTCSAGVCLPAAGVVVINEIDADTAGGTDELELIELYDGGVGNTSLDGVVLVFINGTDEKVYEAFELNGLATDENGFFVIGSGRLDAMVHFLIPLNRIQNGPDAVVLYQGDPANVEPGDALTTENLLDAVVYGLAQDAELAVLTPDQPQANEAGSGNAEGHSIQRVPDGAGGPFVTTAFVAGPPTPGAPNAAP